MAPTTAAEVTRFCVLTGSLGPLGLPLRALGSARGARAAARRSPLGHTLRSSRRLRLLFFRALRRPQHRAATFRAAAAAGVDLVDVRRIALLASDLVVVVELLARL